MNIPVWYPFFCALERIHLPRLEAHWVRRCPTLSGRAYRAMVWWGKGTYPAKKRGDIYFLYTKNVKYGKNPEFSLKFFLECVIVVLFGLLKTTHLFKKT